MSMHGKRYVDDSDAQQGPMFNCALRRMDGTHLTTPGDGYLLDMDQEAAKRIGILLQEAAASLPPDATAIGLEVFVLPTGKLALGFSFFHRKM